VTILRGKDGYGFTICCDSPVRVQAVDPGGPADQAGLQQLDTVLQLNGQPVEQWKCVELAHTIRNSHSEITVSVWRTVPQIKPGFESLIRPSNKCNYNPRSPPSKREKNYSRQPVPSEQRQSCHILYNGTDYSRQPVLSEQRQSCHILYNGTDYSRQPVLSEQRQSCHILYNGTDYSRQPVLSEQRQSCHILYNGTDYSRQPVLSEQRQSCHILYNGTDYSRQPVLSEQRQSCHILYNGTDYSRQPVLSEQRQSCHILYNGTDYSRQPVLSEQRQSCHILYNGTDYSRQPVLSEQRQSCHILYNGTDYSRQPVLSEQRQSCHILYNGTDQGSHNGWAQQEQGESKTAHTVQGPRVAASGDQNYILLAPINPGSQILRPVFQENRGSLGRVYRGRAHGGLQRRSTLIGSTTNISKTPVHTLKNYADYQNCTVVRSHIPHTSYGTYVTLAPKVLIFPVSVQPLDLCNPARSLVLSEEMILHESKHQSIKVTVFIYTDLMLLTREDELGRCNVLQNPLFLQHLKLQENSSEDLKFYLIHVTEKSDCLLSLESYSEKQKRRVCQCLKESIEKKHQERAPTAAEDKIHLLVPLSLIPLCDRGEICADSAGVFTVLQEGARQSSNNRLSVMAVTQGGVLCETGEGLRAKIKQEAAKPPAAGACTECIESLDAWRSYRCDTFKCTKVELIF
ncbi:UNVERIFIED_CONTAM: hypothetical protein FKN15_036883, partial [Acipenser sinensis]